MPHLCIAKTNTSTTTSYVYNYNGESCSFIITLYLLSQSTNNVLPISLKNSFIANSKNKLSF